MSNPIDSTEEFADGTALKHMFPGDPVGPHGVDSIAEAHARGVAEERARCLKAIEWCRSNHSLRASTADAMGGDEALRSAYAQINR